MVLDIELAVCGDLDWFRAIFLDPNREACRLAHPRAGEGCYGGLSRQDVAGVWPRGSSPSWPIPSPPRSLPDVDAAE